MRQSGLIAAILTLSYCHIGCASEPTVFVELFHLNELVFVGTIEESNASHERRALVRATSGEVFPLRIGNSLGGYYGKVKSITTKFVEVEQEFPGCNEEFKAEPGLSAKRTVYLRLNYSFNEATPECAPDWPITVREAVVRVLERMSIEDKRQMRNTPKDQLVKYHFGLGTSIRNEFGLFGGNIDLLRNSSGTPVADYASGVIIDTVWETLQKQKR